MTNYKSLTLYPSGLIGYREERPDIHAHEGQPDYLDAKAKLQAWKDSGVPVEIFPGEHERILALANFYWSDGKKGYPNTYTFGDALYQGVEVKDFIDMKPVCAHCNEKSESEGSCWACGNGRPPVYYAFFKYSNATAALCPTCNHEREVQGNETKSFVPTVEEDQDELWQEAIIYIDEGRGIRFMQSKFKITRI